MTLSTGTNRFKMTITPKFALPLCHLSLFTVFYDTLLQEIFLRSADGIVFVQSFVTDEWVTTAPTKPRGLPPQALPDIKHKFFLWATKVLHSPSTLVKHLSGNWETTQARIFQRAGQQNIAGVMETPNLPRPSRFGFCSNTVCSWNQVLFFVFFLCR